MTGQGREGTAGSLMLMVAPAQAGTQLKLLSVDPRVCVLPSQPISGCSVLGMGGVDTPRMDLGCVKKRVLEEEALFRT
jgi:hypothetical protein